MIGDACIFALTQISNQFDCEYGDLVTRRAGPDIACQSESCRERCLVVYEWLKQIGLEEFEFEDDLTKVPYGVWAKIQFGGLLGLQNLLSKNDSEKVENITEMIELVEQQFGQLNEVPYRDVLPAMKSYRTRRKKK